MKVNKHKNLVKNLLKENKLLRDDDSMLLALVWSKSINKDTTTSANDLLTLLADGKLPNAEAIFRIRRKIQEDNPDLRGEKYEIRQKYKKDVVKQLREMKA